MEFLKNLFGPKFSTGALESPVDPRNIALATFQEPVAIPDEFMTELGPVEDQGSDGKCVGQAIDKVAELYMGKDLSADDLYRQCKEIDGIPTQSGTFPIIGAKVATKSGIATTEAFKTGDPEIIKKSRAENKLAGYAFVNAEYGAICQAIYQNKAITASFSVDTNWFRGKIMRVLKSAGLHYIVLKGFKMSEDKLYGRNSWGIRWIGYIAGKLNPAIKAGELEMLWSDVEGDIRDIIAFTYIPPEILKESTNKQYRFMKTLRKGMSGFEVVKLQERLKLEKYQITKADGQFGPETYKAVVKYQIDNKLTPDGIVGPLMRAKLNILAESLIPLFAKAIQDHEGYFKGSKSFRNNSPANFKIGTIDLTPYMKKLGASGVDPKGFVIFPSYDIGFKALCTFLEDACKGSLSRYKPDMTLRDFFAIYAPSSDDNDPDNYAKVVAKKLGTPVDIKIKELI